jgi:hypothetical protein
MRAPRSSRIRTRFQERQPLWVMAGDDGTLLCARHATAGPVVLAWTTTQELESGVEALFGHAPHLFLLHEPQQRTFRSLLQTASRLRMRLRIDEYVVEGLERAD